MWRMDTNLHVSNANNACQLSLDKQVLMKSNYHVFFHDMTYGEETQRHVYENRIST